MKWVSRLDALEEKRGAKEKDFSPSSESLREVARGEAEQILADLDQVHPDLVIAFFSPDVRDFMEEMCGELRAILQPRAFIGCTAAGLIGGGREVEQRSAIAITAAVLPDVQCKVFTVDQKRLPDMDAAPDKWEDLVGIKPADNPSFIILSDPFTLAIESFVQGLDYAFPKSVKIGGLASGGHTAGKNRLVADDRIYTSGLVGVALSGNIAVSPLVAQGCRPVGKPGHVTRCDRQLLYEIDGMPAAEKLKEMLMDLSEADRKLAKDAVFIGVAMDEFKENQREGDFLIRNILGIEPVSGALLVGESLRNERTVQFHLRDAKSSRLDLKDHLQKFVVDHVGDEISGALLFSCLGRGQYLYGEPNHDSDCLRAYLGQIPIGGFFCNGEIGPVGGSTFLHGYTSSFAIFSPVYQK